MIRAILGGVDAKSIVLVGRRILGAGSDRHRDAAGGGRWASQSASQSSEGLEAALAIQQLHSGVGFPGGA